jgi:hypothetical protein
VSLTHRIHKSLWCRLLGYRSWVDRHGGFREREHFGVLERPHYAYGLLRGADVARFFGHSAITVCEFGVAAGKGLRRLVELSELVRAETGIRIRVVGFDTGEGLPVPRGYKDHPEIWSRGDFSPVSSEQLQRDFAGTAELILGDVADTVDGFVAGLSPEAPLAFAAFDVDMYSSTLDSMRSLSGPADCYLPAVSLYFDDVGFFFANRLCGALAAIDQFNATSELRRVDLDRSLPGRRPERASQWYPRMYACHVLDHEARQRGRERSGLTIEEHSAFMKKMNLY